MSRAFLKDDAVQDAVLIPPRAPLAPGVVNYVTARGLGLLRAELESLEAERSRLMARTGPRQGVDADRTRELTVVNGRIKLLESRIGSARLVDPVDQPPSEVRFGATVTVRTVKTGLERRFTLVGVDEADPSEGRIAFTAPIARAVLGLAVGASAPFRTAAGEEILTVVAIDYGA